MFRVLVNRRKRRVWSPATIAVSVLAHLALLGGALSVATGSPATDGHTDEIIREFPIAPEKPQPEPVKPTPPPPSPARPNQPPPTLGQTRQIESVVEVPKDIPPVNPLDTPVDPSQYSGQGVIGDSIGKPSATPTPPTGGNGGGEGEEVFGMEAVEELPAPRSRDEAARIMRRAYPALLAQAGVTGSTMVQFVIDREGKVVPGSVQVLETTHQDFGAAAVKAVERIRFRPARINGLPVSVSITMPVNWTLEN